MCKFCVFCKYKKKFFVNIKICFTWNLCVLGKNLFKKSLLKTFWDCFSSDMISKISSRLPCCENFGKIFFFVFTKCFRGKSHFLKNRMEVCLDNKRKRYLFDIYFWKFVLQLMDLLKGRVKKSVVGKILSDLPYRYCLWFER